jgi:transposase
VPRPVAGAGEGESEGAGAGESEGETEWRVPAGLSGLLAALRRERDARQAVAISKRPRVRWRDRRQLGMAFHYAGGDRDQLFLMPVSMCDWLDEGHLAWFVLDVVERVDTSAFHVRHPNDGPGRPAYDPEMMLALLFYGYATGLRSSRRIEGACHTDAAFRVICGGLKPDHATIARFVVDHQAALERVFFDVLRLCAAAGLVSAGTIAIDGTKIGAAAALDANRQADWIRSEVARIVAEALAADAAEDAQVGLLGFEELPTELSTRDGRLARLRAALAQIEAVDTAARAEAERRAAKARAAAAEGRKLTGSKPKDPHAALARAEAEHAAALARAEAKAARRAAKQRAAAEQGRKLNGRKPGPDTNLERAAAALKKARTTAQAAAPAPTVANVTDPDSRIMKTKDGFLQGYNCQAAVNEHQIVIACGVTQQANDVRQYEPMVAATQAALDATGTANHIGVVLADAGYWSDHNATADGPDRMIATSKDWKQRKAARDMGTTSGPPPADASPLEAMEHRLRTPEGAAEYAKRSHTVEPIFANSKENRGYRKFRRRGLGAVTSEWALINTVHNLGKLFSHQRRTGLPLAVT